MFIDFNDKSDILLNAVCKESVQTHYIRSYWRKNHVLFKKHTKIYLLLFGFIKDIFSYLRSVIYQMVLENGIGDIDREFEMSQIVHVFDKNNKCINDKRNNSDPI